MDIKALITIHVCVIIIVMLLTACVINKGKKASAEQIDDYYYVNKIRYEGHEYLNLSGNYFIHSESCPCKKGK